MRRQQAAVAMHAMSAADALGPDSPFAADPNFIAREQQQRAWEERFRQWNQQGWQYQQARPGAANPYTEFKARYEKSCAVLGVPVNADPNKIKLAYRRQAKRYHPDLNKDPQATRQFQEINEAYEFLSEENIRRYQNLPPA